MLLAVATYNVWLSLHILAAVIWVGGAATLQIFALRAQRSRDPQRMAAMTAEAEFVGTRVFLPASLVIVILGFVLISDGHFSYQFWVIFALVIWAASAITGSAFLGPESGRINKLVTTEGIESPAVQARMARIFTISRIELGLLILVVLDMAVKPGS